MGLHIAELNHEKAQALTAVGRRAAGGIVPLSHGQEQIWLHTQLVIDVPLYNEPITIYKAGTLDHGLLERALTELVRRHEAWRTNFRVVEGQPVQIIGAPFEVRVPVVDLRGIPVPQREPEALRLAVEDAQRPFDLTAGPLFRALLIRVNDSDHRLYLTLHHIIFDGFSIYRLFLPELAAVYQAYSQGKGSPLPELTVQYSDFAVWQREWLVQSGALASQLDYWKKQLAGVSMMRLPADRPRPAVQSFSGAIHPFALSQQVSQALKMLGRRSGTTLFMTLLAGLAVLMHRYSGLDDVAIATVSSSRKRSELERLLGYFLNPVVLRNNLSGDPTFSETLQRVRDISLDALSNDDAPFTQIVKELHPARTLSANPLFQVLFTLEPPMPVDANGWSVALTQSQVDTKLVKFDLCLELDDAPTGIAGRFKYSADLFDPPTIARMAGHLETLLRAVAANPDERISRIPLLTEYECHQVGVEWNSTEALYATDLCIHNLFETKVEMLPEAAAVVQGKRQLSYRELNARAEGLAASLRGAGVGAEEVVAICLKPSPEMLVAILGVLKAGGACLPLDPSYPRERLQYIVEDSKVKVLLTTSDVKQQLPHADLRVICLDQEIRPSTAPSSVSPAKVGPDNLAYVIYTSGSTGTPKGVLITHRNLVHSTQARLRYYTALNSRFLLLSSFAYDSSLVGIFGTLCQGGTLVLCPGTVQECLPELAQLVARHRISELLCVPSVYGFLLEQATASQLASLRTAIVAGESCAPELIERHYKLLPHTVLYNEYGPTEASIWSTVYKCRPKQTRLLVPIGRPIANTRVYVVDRHLNLVPVGVAGEICISGPGLVRGYLNRPDLTAERFVRDRFSSDPKDRLYRTGDIARYLPDGNLELLGRLDEQVKIRGFRIELEEISSVIAEHPSVRHAVAALREEDNHGSPELVAYVVPVTPNELDPKQLRRFLKQRLPEVMVPSVIVTLERLPLTPNGKVDRRALPAPQTASDVVHDAAIGPVETRLVDIFEKVLGKHPVGTTQNFFDLGGHSLLVARLLLLIEQTFHKKLSLGEVFQAPTVKELAALLANGTRSNGTIVPIQPSGSRTPLFWVRGGPLYLALSRRLGPDQPLLGLHLPTSDAAELPLPYKLEDIAAALIERMREAQPTGPYKIAGLCVNGVIAYEMALQLRNAGQEVALLALFDAQNPAYYRDFSLEGRGSLMWKKACYHLTNLHRSKLKQMPGFVRDRMTGIGRRLSVMRWRINYVFGLPVGNSHLEDLDTIIHPASYEYQPQPYEGKVVFFQSTDWPKGHYWEFHVGWNKLVAGMDIYHIPGGHESMFHEENVDLLARNLRECLGCGEDVKILNGAA
ncbi:MAG: non-ribosomal peptide synthetase [Terriglobales bacterium]